MNSFWEARIGSVIAAAGVIWGVNEVTTNFTSIVALPVPTGGPLELAALGIVLWLHAKYRRSISIHHH